MQMDSDAVQDAVGNVGKVAQTIQNGMESFGKNIGAESAELFNALKDKVTDFAQSLGDKAQDSKQEEQNGK